MEDILTWQTGVFTLAIFVFSFLLRRTAEVIFPTLRQDTPLSTAQRVWEELLLPSIPVFVGIAFGIAVKSWPYPAVLVSRGSHVIYGAVCGFFSSYAYRVVKATITQKFSVDLPDIAGASPDMNLPKPPGSSGGKGG